MNSKIYLWALQYISSLNEQPPARELLRRQARCSDTEDVGVVAQLGLTTILGGYNDLDRYTGRTAITEVPSASVSLS